MFLFPMPLYREARYFVINRFGFGTLESKVRRSIGQLVLHAGPELYLLFLFVQAETPTSESARDVRQVQDPAEGLVICGEVELFSSK